MPDATALAASITEGRTTACAVMEASLSACDAQKALGAVVYLDDEMARAGAEAADRLPSDRQGPFHGVPFLAKDLGAGAKGLPASAGSAALRAMANKPVADSKLFEGFRRAGLIPFGISTTPPFGIALSCEPDGLPPARNPWDQTLTPGGSSGGAAAAVASGIVAIAHATDAAGSIRVPAACCGLVGLKPSRGAVPAGPDFSNHLMGIASELVFARSVRDVRVAFEAVQVPGKLFDEPDRMRVGLALPARCDAAQQAAARGAAEALSEAGLALSEIPAPDDLGGEAGGLARLILSVAVAEWLDALEVGDSDVPPLVAAIAAEARSVPVTDLFAAARQVERLSSRAQRLFAKFDAVVMPVLASRPLGVGAFDLSHTDVDAHFGKMAAFAPNVALANVAGLPAMVLPFGIADGLPVGVQLLGCQGTDLKLCKLAALIEERAPALAYPNPIAGLAA